MPSLSQSSQLLRILFLLLYTNLVPLSASNLLKKILPAEDHYVGIPFVMYNLHNHIPEWNTYIAHHDIYTVLELYKKIQNINLERVKILAEAKKDPIRYGLILKSMPAPYTDLQVYNFLNEKKFLKPKLSFENPSVSNFINKLNTFLSARLYDMHEIGALSLLIYEDKMREAALVFDMHRIMHLTENEKLFIMLDDLKKNIFKQLEDITHFEEQTANVLRTSSQIIETIVPILKNNRSIIQTKTITSPKDEIILSNQVYEQCIKMLQTLSIEPSILKKSLCNVFCYINMFISLSNPNIKMLKNIGSPHSGGAEPAAASAEAAAELARRSHTAQQHVSLVTYFHNHPSLHCFLEADATPTKIYDKTMLTAYTKKMFKNLNPETKIDAEAIISYALSTATLLYYYYTLDDQIEKKQLKPNTILNMVQAYNDAHQKVVSKNESLAKMSKEFNMFHMFHRIANILTDITEKNAPGIPIDTLYTYLLHTLTPEQWMYLISMHEWPQTFFIIVEDYLKDLSPSKVQTIVEHYQTQKMMIDLEEAKRNALYEEYEQQVRSLKDAKQNLTGLVQLEKQKASETKTAAWVAKQKEEQQRIALIKAQKAAQIKADKEAKAAQRAKDKADFLAAKEAVKKEREAAQSATATTAKKTRVSVAQQVTRQKNQNPLCLPEAEQDKEAADPKDHLHEGIAEAVTDTDFDQTPHETHAYNSQPATEATAEATVATPHHNEDRNHFMVTDSNPYAYYEAATTPYYMVPSTYYGEECEYDDYGYYNQTDNPHHTAAAAATAVATPCHMVPYACDEGECGYDDYGDYNQTYNPYHTAAAVVAAEIPMQTMPASPPSYDMTIMMHQKQSVESSVQSMPPQPPCPVDIEQPKWSFIQLPISHDQQVMTAHGIGGRQIVYNNHNLIMR